MVTDKCMGCTTTDIYIAAALAQNGSGFDHVRMQKMQSITSRSIREYSNPDVSKEWFDLFENDAKDLDMVNTKIQLDRFDLVVNELRSRRWIVPFIDSRVIEILKRWPVSK